jgi:Immunoglobulin I-set domain/Immunoglobulin domain
LEPIIRINGSPYSSNMVVVSLGDTIKLQCQSFFYYKQFDASWSFNKQVVENQANKIDLEETVDDFSSTKTLTIYNLTTEDLGNYKCESTEMDEFEKYFHSHDGNFATIRTVEAVSVNLILQEFLPKLKASFIKDLVLKVNQTLTLTCECESKSTCNIEWNKNGEVIENYYSEFKQSWNTSTNLIKIVNLTRENTGSYSCLAGNDYGFDLKTIFVTVVEGKRLLYFFTKCLFFIHIHFR